MLNLHSKKYEEDRLKFFAEIDKLYVEYNSEKFAQLLEYISKNMKYADFPTLSAKKFMEVIDFKFRSDSVRKIHILRKAIQWTTTMHLPQPHTGTFKSKKISNYIVSTF